MSTFLKALSSKAISWATEMVRRGRFELWMREYGRTYADAAEKERRFACFNECLDFIKRYNAHARTLGPHASRAGLNQFSDISFEEFASRFPRVSEEGAGMRRLQERKVLKEQRRRRRRLHKHIKGPKTSSVGLSSQY